MHNGQFVMLAHYCLIMHLNFISVINRTFLRMNIKYSLHNFMGAMSDQIPGTKCGLSIPLAYAQFIVKQLNKIMDPPMTALSSSKVFKYSNL